MRINGHEVENLVGLTGMARSGKSEASRFMESQYGFQAIHPSDVVKAALVKRHGEQEFGRPEYRAMARELRAIGGPDWYLKVTDLNSPRIMIDGTRHLERADYIRSQGGFMLGFIARLEVRYERALQARDDKRKPASLEEFARDEQPELNSTDGTGGQILAVLETIDPSHRLDTSDMSLEEVRAWVATILADHGIKPQA